MLEIYKKKLKRFQSQLEKLENSQEAKGGPMHLTYHGGWDKGYLQGKISILEDIIDDLEGNNK